MITKSEFQKRIAADMGEPNRKVVAHLWFDDNMLDLVEDENFIGSDDCCDVVVNSPEVSGRHAMIEIEDKTAKIRDLKSKQGTWVCLEKGSYKFDKLGVDIKTATLNGGTLIKFGTAECRFEWTESASKAPNKRIFDCETQRVDFGFDAFPSRVTLHGNVGVDDDASTDDGLEAIENEEEFFTATSAPGAELGEASGDTDTISDKHMNADEVNSEASDESQDLLGRQGEEDEILVNSLSGKPSHDTRNGQIKETVDNYIGNNNEARKFSHAAMKHNFWNEDDDDSEGTVDEEEGPPRIPANHTTSSCSVGRQIIHGQKKIAVSLSPEVPTQLDTTLVEVELEPEEMAEVSAKSDKEDDEDDVGERGFRTTTDEDSYHNDDAEQDKAEKEHIAENVVSNPVSDETAEEPQNDGEQTTDDIMQGEIVEEKNKEDNIQDRMDVQIADETSTNETAPHENHVHEEKIEQPEEIPDIKPSSRKRKVGASASAERDEVGSQQDSGSLVSGGRRRKAVDIAEDKSSSTEEPAKKSRRGTAASSVPNGDDAAEELSGVSVSQVAVESKKNTQNSQSSTRKDTAKGKQATPASQENEEVRIMFTKIDEQKYLAGLSRIANVTVTADATQCTHCVTTSELKRTPKLMVAINSGVRYVVTEQWVKDSVKAKHVVDVVTVSASGEKRAQKAKAHDPRCDAVVAEQLASSPYIVHDAEKEEAWGFRLADTLALPAETRGVKGGLFAGYTVVCTDGVCGEMAPPVEEMQAIVESGGGEWLMSVDAWRKKGVASGLIIISHPSLIKKEINKKTHEALNLARKNKEDSGVYTIELIFLACLQQKLDFGTNKLV